MVVHEAKTMVVVMIVPVAMAVTMVVILMVVCVIVGVRMHVVLFVRVIRAFMIVTLPVLFVGMLLHLLVFDKRLYGVFDFPFFDFLFLVDRVGRPGINQS